MSIDTGASREQRGSALRVRHAENTTIIEREHRTVKSRDRIHRQHLVLGQTDGQRLGARTVLHRRADIRRELTAMNLAAGAAHMMNLVFGDIHLHRRQIEDLVRLADDAADQWRSRGVA